MTHDEINRAVEVAREQIEWRERHNAKVPWGPVPMDQPMVVLARAVLALDERVRVATQLCDAAMRRAEAAEAKLGQVEHALADAMRDYYLAYEEAPALNARLKAAEARVAALVDQIEAGGCAVAHDGERTHECRADNPCGLCRLRARAALAKARVKEEGTP